MAEGLKNINPNLLLRTSAAIAAVGSVVTPAAAPAPAQPLRETVDVRTETAELATEDAFLISASAMETQLLKKAKKPRQVRYWYGPAGELGVLKRLGTAGNAKLAFKLAQGQSWYSHTQVGCVDEVWYEESKFEVHSHNAYSQAGGIPQANPEDKMGSEGSDWQNNPTTQIKWGYGYMKGRYGTPCNAEAFHNAHGYY